MSNEIQAPLEFPEQKVPAQWIDFNGHMNVAYYVFAFDRCVDDMFNLLGIGPAQIRQSNCSAFTLELHINYLGEVMEGDLLKVDGRLLDHDEKRLHAYFEMRDPNRGRMVAAMEQVGIHVDMDTRKPIPFSTETMGLLAGMKDSHSRLARPEYAGRIIGIRPKPHSPG